MFDYSKMAYGFLFTFPLDCGGAFKERLQTGSEESYYSAVCDCVHSKHSIGAGSFGIGHARPEFDLFLQGRAQFGSFVFTSAPGRRQAFGGLAKGSGLCYQGV
jgi:hypothetical protein